MGGVKRVPSMRRREMFIKIFIGKPEKIDTTWES